MLTTVQISDAIVVHPGSQVTVPVTVDDTTGIRAAEIRIEYDAAQLDVRAKDIVAGNAWAGRGVAMASVDQQAGVLTIFAFSTTSLAEGSGTLVDVPFTIKNDISAVTVAIDLAEVKLNEGQIELAAIPIPGTDTTDGTLTIVHGKTSPPNDLVQVDLRRVCSVTELHLSQESFVQPLPPLDPMPPIHFTLIDEVARLHRGRGFIGPVGDLVFANTYNWRRMR